MDVPFAGPAEFTQASFCSFCGLFVRFQNEDAFPARTNRGCAARAYQAYDRDDEFRSHPYKN